MLTPEKADEFCSYNPMDFCGCGREKTMPRYIDADDIEKDLVRYADSIDKTQTFSGVLRLIVRDTPTADVEPVKHGKWLIRETAFEETEAKCSLCGFETLVNEPGNGLHMVDDLKYCPRCGARMDGEVDEIT